MMDGLFSKFSIHREKEETGVIVENIERGVVFRGTNLWVLIFAIFIASLGLNVNSTAVIIGAMLISPLMGPIMGLGLAIAINDVQLFRKSLYNYLLATGAALTTSTVFFLISPLNEAHSEILARTSPNIYDVLIALFGGFAGIIATASKQKGNVIPGVAIATALMPPLCTAGYGLATLKLNFFIGAFYLFIINTVFIALATFLTSRFLKLPFKHFPDKKADTRAHRIIWLVVIVTLVPSIYLGYDLVQQDKFAKQASRFIDAEGNFPNDYLLNKKIDAKRKTISLVYGGAEISPQALAAMKTKLKNFDLQEANLEIHQGFGYVAETSLDDNNNAELKKMDILVKSTEIELNTANKKLDSLKQISVLGNQLFKELKVQYTDLQQAVFTPTLLLNTDSTVHNIFIAVLQFERIKSAAEKEKIENWLKTRIQRTDVKVVF